MTEARLPPAELLRKAGAGDFLRAVAEAALQLPMEADVEGPIGAGRHERSPARLDYRNGCRERASDTRLGSPQPRIPKLRQGARFPPFLEPRETREEALVSPSSGRPGSRGRVHPARGRPPPCRAMGLSGMYLREHGLEAPQGHRRAAGQRLPGPAAGGGEWPYPWPDATRLRVREGGRILGPDPRTSVAAMIAVAVDTEGRREIVGLHLGPSEAETFRSTFLKSPVKRGPKGVRLVIPDAHEGGSRARSDGCRAPPGSAAGCIG